MAEDQNTSWLRRAIQEIVAANDAATREIVMSGGVLPALSRGVTGAIDDASVNLTGAPLVMSRPPAPTQQAAPASQLPAQSARATAPESQPGVSADAMGLLAAISKKAAKQDQFIARGDDVRRLSDPSGKFGKPGGNGNFSRALIKGAKNSAQKNLTGFDESSFSGLGLPPETAQALGMQASQARSSGQVAPFAEMLKAIFGSQATSPLNVNAASNQDRAIMESAANAFQGGNQTAGFELLQLLTMRTPEERAAKFNEIIARTQKRR